LLRSRSSSRRDSSARSANKVGSESSPLIWELSRKSSSVHSKSTWPFS
jgi:hypothetical protein